MRLHNRQVKAKFWQDTELIRALPIAGRMFYEGLWQLADDSGCLEDDVYLFKMHLFSLDVDITPELLTEWRAVLIKLHKLVAYVSNGQACLFLKNFHKHQALDKPVGPSKDAVPLPPWIEWEQGDTRRTSRYLVRDVSGTCPGQAEDVPGVEPRTLNLEPPGGDPPLTPPPGEDAQSIPYAEIIDHLNQAASTNYKHSNKATRKHINARWAEGYRFADFCHVIDKKAREWLGMENEKYLRPETLFNSSKFENYLNQPEAIRGQPPNKPRGRPAPPGKKPPKDKYLDLYWR